MKQDQEAKPEVKNEIDKVEGAKGGMVAEFNTWIDGLQEWSEKKEEMSSSLLALKDFLPKANLKPAEQKVIAGYSLDAVEGLVYHVTSTGQVETPGDKVKLIVAFSYMSRNQGAEYGVWDTYSATPEGKKEIAEMEKTLGLGGVQ